MKTLLSILVLLTLQGCAVLRSIDGTLCVLATEQQAELAAAFVLSEIKEGPDKEKAKQALRWANLTTELKCEAVRAIRQTALDDK